MITESSNLRDKAFEVGIRQQLFTLISECPGLHFRDVQRRTEAATGNLSYHLEHLVKAGLLEPVRDGKYLRYYVPKEASVEQKGILKLVRLKTDRHILLILLQNGVSTNEQLSEILHLSPSTISWHLKKLVNADILNASAVGRKTIYSIKDSDFVSKILIKYKESFLDTFVDRFVDMMEL